ncbi:META domain-containing protein [Streptomyces sp. DSM 44915]|uniref:META domain-containing protein n=1 Tax=Streptomyces chisholmiae TaxID=3075540 RepID=A0ABU2JRT9_9ACTN|nr:META domain-containing protein [Streptomyces sp. DSM 44915]MDT0267704.1 META domain-containing protein [Streptomyces sp. DSM 44915]
MRQRPPLLAGLLALAATAALAGCQADSTAATDDPAGRQAPTEEATEAPPDGGAAPEQLTKSRWLPERVTVDGTAFPRPPGLTLVHLDLPDVEEFRAERGCRYGSDVTADGATLRVAEVVRTEAGCPEDDGTFAEHFLGVFRGELAYALHDADGPGQNEPATLTLTDPAGDTVTLTENLPIPVPTT